MRRTNKIAVAILGSMVLAFGCTMWTFWPLGARPLLGIQRTPDELVEFATSHNIIILVDPVPVIKHGIGSYFDWALAELATRRPIAIAL